MAIIDNIVTNIKKLPNSGETSSRPNAKENMANENYRTWHKAIADLTDSFYLTFYELAQRQ